jgi:serine/threonine protein kinase
MSESFAGEFVKSELAQAAAGVLPEAFSARYDVLERLARSPFGETYLLADKHSGGRVVFKRVFKSGAGGGHSEGELLAGLCHEGLPKFLAEGEDAEAFYLLREYAEGIPLDQYVAARGPLPKPLALRLAQELCGILAYLHGQPQPVIHRDIKPSNVIVAPAAHKVTLIDFGISRRYAENADRDTLCWGTKQFAPPEQYGFAQTDGRADIYYEYPFKQ